MSSESPVSICCLLSGGFAVYVSEVLLDTAAPTIFLFWREKKRKLRKWSTEKMQTVMHIPITILIFHVRNHRKPSLATNRFLEFVVRRISSTFIKRQLLLILLLISFMAHKFLYFFWQQTFPRAILLTRNISLEDMYSL